MILLRSQTRANEDNGVRFRVAACRKRLRYIRTTHRALNQIQLDKLSQPVFRVSAAMFAGGPIFAPLVGHSRVQVAQAGASAPTRDVNPDLEEVRKT